MRKANKRRVRLAELLVERICGGEIPQMVVTLGSRGAVYASMDGTCGFCPTVNVDVVDTTGCGDAMTAGLAYGIANNLSPEDTMKIACACGTAAALTDGTQAPSAGSIAGFEDKIRIIRL